MSISILILLFAGYKASQACFTHDESYTYLHYVHLPVKDIITYKDPFTNNHILNTLLMKVFEKAFGTSEIVLRLPNIFSLAIYLWFTWLLIRKIHPIIQLPVFMLMTFNPYLLDFFSLARGYGLSIGFMTMSLYFLIRYFNTYKSRDLMLFNGAAFLATYSNFALLNYYLSALVIYNVVLYLPLWLSFHKGERQTRFFKNNAINFISLLFSGIIFFEPLRKIVRMNILDFGGKHGFVQDTISTLINSFLYESSVSAWVHHLLSYFLVFIILVSLAVIIAKCFHWDPVFTEKFRMLFIVNGVLVLIAFSTILQHYIFHNDYYTGRFALFMYPLFILIFVYLTDYLFRKSKGTRVPIIVFFLFLIPFLSMHLSTNINTSYYPDWKYDMATKNMLKVLSDKVHHESPDKQEVVQLGIGWVFEPAINFYRTTQHYNWLKKVNREGLKPNDDYRYIFKTDINSAMGKKPVIFSSATAHTILLRNK